MSIANKKLTLFLVLVFLFLQNARAQQESVVFDKVVDEEKKSPSIVHTIVEGQDGFMWFGAASGLYRYDGYNFKIYRHEENNPNSLSSSTIRSLAEDSKGNLWIGTQGGGLNHFEISTGKFTTYRHNPKDSTSISGNDIWTIFEDSKGTIWVGTWGNGLNKFDSKTNTFKHYKKDPQNPKSIGHNVPRTIAEDKDGNLWIGTQGGGIYQFNQETEEFTAFKHDPSDPKSLSNNSVFAIYIDKENTVWIGTNGGGLNVLNPTTKEIEHYQYNALAINMFQEQADGKLWLGTSRGIEIFDKVSRAFIPVKDNSDLYGQISSTVVRSIIEDSKGQIWIGTENKAYKLRKKKNFKTIRGGGQEDLNSLSHNTVRCIYEDSNHTIWYGTFGGLNSYNPNTDKWECYLPIPGDPSSLASVFVVSIFEDLNKNLWVGTRNGYLHLFDRERKTFKRIIHQQDPKNSPNMIQGIIQRDENSLWVGTENGLSIFDTKNQSWKHIQRYPNDSLSISGDGIQSNALLKDSNDALWIGVWANGLNKMIEDYPNPKFVSWKHDPNDSQSLSNNNVISLLEDSKGDFWVGTYGGGLNLFDRNKGTFKTYDISDGLASNVVFGILEDNNGNLWLSTNGGLSYFNSEEETFQNFYEIDGLQSDAFFWGAAMKHSDGQLFFGGVNGINHFYPKSVLKNNNHIPPIVITKFSKNNHEVSFNKPLHLIDTIFLTHTDNFFAFEFAALDFEEPSKNKYLFKLENFNKDWIEAGYNRMASYTNLDPGHYTFKVIGSNNDGHWNKTGTSITVIISPPWWQTYYAYLGYIILCICFVFFIYKIEQKRLKREKKINAKLRDADRLKDEFLANTSHELRTPLHGIIGIAESLEAGAIGDISPEMREKLNMISNSGKQLATLVNDILDFSKLKNKEITLSTQSVNLYIVVEKTLRLTKPLATQKELQLFNLIRSDLPQVLVDENRVKQILYNLIGNAIKFTNKGSITISAEVIDGAIAISIADTGIGISEKNINLIFESFEQTPFSIQKKYSGTGLGLAISKQLVELHGGEISVTSTIDKGSVFTFTLPTVSNNGVEVVTRKAVTPSKSSVASEKGTSIETLSEIVTIAPEKEQSDDFFKNSTILIVDDEFVNRKVLLNYLKLKGSTIIEAENGEEALLVLENTPSVDLIILDVMMPRLNGYETCQRIRLNLSPLELPIVLLTAKTLPKDLAEGFRSGANDYIKKPISQEEFYARIGMQLQLLKSNRALKEAKNQLEKYSSELERKVEERTIKIERQKAEIILKNQDLEDKKLKVEERNKRTEQILVKLKSTQALLVQSEKMSSLGVLTAGIAHELNNPINYVSSGIDGLKKAISRIYNVVSLIQEITPENATTKIVELQDERDFQQFKVITDLMLRVTNNIAVGAHKASEIVRGLRTFAHDNQNDLELADLHEGINSTLLLFHHQLSDEIEIIKNYGNIPPVSCHLASINQVFMNILSNAIQALEGKGTVTITTLVKGDFIKISISDSGKGIPKEQQEKVFEPFFTTKKVGKGTGLGLSISHTIIKEHQGEIQFTSIEGEGSTFNIYLPINKTN